MANVIGHSTNCSGSFWVPVDHFTLFWTCCSDLRFVNLFISLLWQKVAYPVKILYNQLFKRKNDPYGVLNA